MPIANYSVLKGHPTAGKVVSGASAHYDITLQTESGTFTVAVNIESINGSEVLYAIKHAFTPPNPTHLQALGTGMTPLPSQPGGLALDFVRSTVNGAPMITRAQMTPLPIAQNSAVFLREALSGETRHRTGAAHALQNAVVTLLNQAVADPNSMIYAFGSAYADSGAVDGIHDIHMNQGNPLGGHGSQNGIWQDGALFVNLGSSVAAQASWNAIFIAFQTESWTTDNAGNPV